jgi:hypothetical protein
VERVDNSTTVASLQVLVSSSRSTVGASELGFAWVNSCAEFGFREGPPSISIRLDMPFFVVSESTCFGNDSLLAESRGLLVPCVCESEGDDDDACSHCEAVALESRCQCMILNYIACTYSVGTFD